PFRSEQLILAPNVPRGTDVEVKTRRELSGYYAHIQATDRAIGRLLSQLPSTTIVVFTSVHGDMHGAHGLFRKGWPYEESIRVPLLVRGAPVKAAPTTASPSLASLTATHHLPISLVSLPAMTLSWAEGQPWTPTQGTVDISMPSVVALPQQCDRSWHGRRSPTHKWIYQADGTLWLEFNLLEDPLEQRNLA
ncbi:MAG TPA: sulfatase-like hydrolase/transferase, partial [Opitutaceae bacterium]|nr:sulfatase-like hydrolase/transferase [Opitutaceae bacterium]